MEFTECAKGRLTLTLKSSLLCAVMLMSAPTLAESLETAKAAEKTRPALVANPDAIIRTSAMSVTTAALVANLMRQFAPAPYQPANSVNTPVLLDTFSVATRFLHTRPSESWLKPLAMAELIRSNQN
ncbi:MAG: hypothetical protein HC889_01255 [Synechococcaceae cyanobacterium SM1_2_3]|nr:hypothetical protein [Synechococcaceae cyanobacterium SM1_2_3]